MSRKLLFIFTFISMALASNAVFADVKVKTKQTMSGQTYENTTYIKGKRQRSEMMNGMMINITQCDLRRGIQINQAARTYMVNPFDTGSENAVRNGGSVEKTSTTTKGGVVTTTVTTKDTGERKQMFGYTARHLIITMETESSPDSCSKANSKMVTDGWYIDFEPQFDCGDVSSFSRASNYKQSGCQDKYTMKTVGTAKRGYPVYEKMTMFDGTGKETTSFVNEVVELSKATLDQALFEVPENYREVTDASQMYAATSSVSMNNSVSSATSSSMSGITSSGSTILSNNRTSTSASNADTFSSTANSPKKEGVVRIGLAGVKTGAVGEGLAAADLAAAVQNSMQEYLKSPNLEVVVLEGKLPAAIDADAKAKQCDVVLYTTVSHKKGGGGGFGGMFGQVLGSTIARTGIGATGSVVGNIAGQVATQAIVSATSLSANVKAKDEVTLEIRLVNSDGSALAAQAFKAKARSGGEDIISQVVEQAAQTVFKAVVK